MNRMSSERHFVRDGVFLIVVLGLAAVVSLDAPAAQVAGEEPTEVATEAAVQLGEAAATAAFGAVELAHVTPYLDPDSHVSVYAIEYA